MKISTVMSLALAVSFFALPAIALAAPVEKVDGFVCPVLTATAVGQHNPQAVPIGEGHYSIIGPNVSVPINATNGDGAGTPPGPHAAPGDSGYSPIWSL